MLLTQFVSIQLWTLSHDWMRRTVIMNLSHQFFKWEVHFVPLRWAHSVHWLWITGWEETSHLKSCTAKLWIKPGDHFLKLSPQGTRISRWCRLHFKPSGIIWNESYTLLGRTPGPYHSQLFFLFCLPFFSLGLYLFLVSLSASLSFFVVVVINKTNSPWQL